MIAFLLFTDLTRILHNIKVPLLLIGQRTLIAPCSESLKNNLGIDQLVDNEKINPSACLSIQTPSTKLVVVPKNFFVPPSIEVNDSSNRPKVNKLDAANNTFDICKENRNGDNSKFAISNG